jgi:hypothetical protein
LGNPFLDDRLICQWRKHGYDAATFCRAIEQSARAAFLGDVEDRRAVLSCTGQELASAGNRAVGIGQGEWARDILVLQVDQNEGSASEARRLEVGAG